MFLAKSKAYEFYAIFWWPIETCSNITAGWLQLIVNDIGGYYEDIVEVFHHSQLAFYHTLLDFAVKHIGNIIDIMVYKNISVI